MKLLIFTEGTALMHPSADKKDDFSSYVPVKNAVKKLNGWIEDGAEISYLTSRIKFNEIRDIQEVLKKFNFPGTIVHSRRQNETYVEVVEKIKPNIFIEDDCKSIGAEEMITPKLNPELNIHGIVVPEFGGLDHLPDDLADLKEYGAESMRSKIETGAEE